MSGVASLPTLHASSKRSSPSPCERIHLSRRREPKNVDRGSDLRATTLSGVRWTGLSRFVSEGTALGSAIVLARLVDPAEFGRAAVALSIIALAQVLGSAGI